MKREAICAACGQPFTAKKYDQRFCSAKCRRWGDRHGLAVRPEIPEGAPVIRCFHCARCGALVTVHDMRDRRRRFCSVRCERLYWKHRKAESKKAQ